MVSRCWGPLTEEALEAYLIIRMWSQQSPLTSATALLRLLYCGRVETLSPSGSVQCRVRTPFVLALGTQIRIVIEEVLFEEVHTITMTFPIAIRSAVSYIFELNADCGSARNL